ncbi:MAG TPA: nucleoid-structuring protein H-NS [Mycobacterium sp.]|nr:nucleoid-structuring protein H-NS [Mycobacterium sp.]
MAEAQDPPNVGPGEPQATPPVPKPPEKAAAKKTPAKKAPAKKAAKKTPAKKTPAKSADAAKTASKKPPAKKAQPALEPPAPHAALEPPTPHAALAAGNGSPPLVEAAREAAANAKSSVERAGSPVPAVAEHGRSPLPFAVAFALTVLIALLVHRLRHRSED